MTNLLFLLFSAPSVPAVFCVRHEEHRRRLWYEPSGVDQAEDEGDHPNQKRHGGKCFCK